MSTSEIIAVCDNAIAEERSFDLREIAFIITESGDRKQEVLTVINSTKKFTERPAAVRALFPPAEWTAHWGQPHVSYLIRRAGRRRV